MNSKLEHEVVYNLEWIPFWNWLKNYGGRKKIKKEKASSLKFLPFNEVEAKTFVLFLI